MNYNNVIFKGEHEHDGKYAFCPVPFPLHTENS